MPPKRPKRPPDRVGNTTRVPRRQRHENHVEDQRCTEGYGGHLAGRRVDRFSAAGPSMDAHVVEVALNPDIAGTHGDGQISTHASFMWGAGNTTPT